VHLDTSRGRTSRISTNHKTKGTQTFRLAIKEDRGISMLIDGEELVELMIDHGAGVEPVRIATLHRINEDFFESLWQLAGPLQDQVVG
jgi:restriction endonuclease Mrr